MGGAVVIFTAACATNESNPKADSPQVSTASPETEKHFLNEGFVLSKQEIPELERKAKAGNEDAVLKLVNYYELVLNDTARAIYWSKIGVKHGSKICEHNLKVFRDEED